MSRFRNSLGIAAIILSMLISCGKNESELSAHGLRAFEIEMDPERVGEMLGGAYARLELPGKVRVEGREYAVKIRAAGSSTIVLPKKSFDLEFLDDDFEGAGEVRLSTTAADPSMLRTPIALEIFKDAGLPTSKWEFVTVFLNRRPLGLYLQIEKVDSKYFKKRGINWARIYKAEDHADFRPDMPSRLTAAFSGKPEPQNLQRMAELARVGEISDDAEFEREVFKILSRASAINYMVASQLTNHYDGFNKNIVYVERAENGLLEIAPWDFDLTWRSDLSSPRDAWNRNPLWARIYKLPSVKEEVDARVGSFAQGRSSLQKLEQKINLWSDMIAEAYASDPFFEGPQEAATADLRREIEERLKSLQ